jgi:NADH-quinone oxidoreductase subunit J
MLTAAISATSILLSRNVFKAALSLLVCLLSIAALYVLNFAEFIAVTQILIYAGGVLVLIVFGIMLTTRLSGKPLKIGHTNIFSGLLAGTALFVMLVVFFTSHTFAFKHYGMPSATLETIGTGFMTHHSLPFELAGILLLVALIGAAVTASFIKSNRS